MRFSAQRLLGLAALSLVIGCQQVQHPAGPPFGVDVLNAPQTHEAAIPLDLAGGQPIPADSYVPDQLLVQLADDADTQAALAGFVTLGEVRFNKRFAAVQLPGDLTLAEANRLLASRPGVAGVELNRIHRPSASSGEPDDPRFAEQWSHRRTAARDLWQSDVPVVDASGVIVAVLDTGLDVTHPEFAGRVIAPQNMILDENPSASAVPVETDVKDLVGHGTHCAGIIGASGNNQVGVAGVSWNVNLMPVKVLGANGGTDFQVLQGISYALGEDLDGNGTARASYLTTEGLGERRVRVISMSLGAYYHGRRPAYDDAFARARDMGVMVVVAAGNEGSEVATPANAAHALAVSATSPYRIGNQIWEWLSGFSNRGDRIDLAAPGGLILSTVPTYETVDDEGSPLPTDYSTASGTSMACPYVAGTAALVVAKHDPEHHRKDAAFYDAVRQHLLATTDDMGAPGKDPLYGWGRVNVQKAVTAGFPAMLAE
jgi:serine protease